MNSPEAHQINQQLLVQRHIQNVRGTFHGICPMDFQNETHLNGNLTFF